MRLVQKSLLHTGYFVTQDKKIIPAFTADLVNESMMCSRHKEVRRIYGVLREDEIFYILKLIKEFKRKHGIIPQNLTEYLRTGFATNGELKQSHNKFIYK